LILADDFSIKTKIVLSALMSILMACDSKKLDKEIDSTEEANQSSNSFTLLRKWQRVVRFDCAGKIYSDQQETVQSPRAPVSITPYVFENLYSSSFRNLTNGSAGPAVSNFVTFVIDMAPTFLNLKVEEGVNEIGYEFSYCQELKKDGKGQPTSECEHIPVVKESGTLFIFVIYLQMWSDELLEIHPDQKNCRKT
jgi:hypothetical protein